jgi:hypothetical protein
MIFAASGALAYNESGTGLYLSQDGGNSWEKVTFPGLSDETRTSVDILPEADNYKVIIGTKSNGCFEGEYPREILFPLQPLIISPSKQTNVSRRPTFLWHASDLAMNYDLHVAEDSSFSSTVFDTTITDTVLQLNDPLSAKTQYYWQVSAADIYGESSHSLITSFTTGTMVNIADEMNEIPKTYWLSQNYPNPFNPATTITYSVPKTSFVSIKVYNVLGKEVADLVGGEKPAGTYKLIFSANGGSASGGNGKNFSSGVYFYRMQTGGFTSTKKFILIK